MLQPSLLIIVLLYRENGAYMIAATAIDDTIYYYDNITVSVLNLFIFILIENNVDYLLSYK